MTTGFAAGQNWQFWIDRGGTFTDIVARGPDSQLVTHKLLSESPGHYEDAVSTGIRQLLSLPHNAAIPDDAISEIRMGTTVATNALLEKRYAPVVLVVTRGFADLLRIAYQNRPELFALDIERPAMLYERVVEADERLAADGTVVRALDTASLVEQLEAARRSGIDSCAIVFMHSYRNAAHEAHAAQLAAAAGFSNISVSSELGAVMRIVSRGDTTVLDACLTPVVQDYMQRLTARLPARMLEPGRLTFMQSNGGLIGARDFRGKDAVLSGPAGGVIAMVELGRQAGYERLIGFDMGGTSTDVCHYRGELERQTETTVAGYRLQTPMLAVHTVAAGGGSVLKFESARYLVGPDSAGASPGPAAYGKGGPLTITDCQVLLGRLQPDFFPSVFGADGQQPIDTAQVRSAFGVLAGSMGISADDAPDAALETVAEGFLAIAIGHMAHAIAHITTQKGHDVTDYALFSFGGAGGQHACRIADTLGISEILLHRYAGVLSALGMGLAELREITTFSVEDGLSASALEVLERRIALAQTRNEHVLKPQLDVASNSASLSHKILLQLRLSGSDTTLPVPLADLAEVERVFCERYRAQFGFEPSDPELIIESVQVETHSNIAATAQPQSGEMLSNTSAEPPVPIDRRPVFFNGQYHDTPFHQRDQLLAGHQVKGPAVIIEPASTIVVEPGWTAVCVDDGLLRLARERTTLADTGPSTAAREIPVDPIRLELFNNIFMFIAEQMGIVLQHTALSVNIKERLDFSCAVFNAHGELVANAPHMPVHLGSMSHSVKHLLKTLGPEGDNTLQPNSAFAMNDPYQGGTHLPDITVVKPLYGEDGKTLICLLAARGHHADVGGITPGSMPAFSRHIDEEGILLSLLPIVENGSFRTGVIREIFEGGQWPARNIDCTLADLQAQLAACERGASLMLDTIEQYGRQVCAAYMGHIQDNAELSVRAAISQLEGGRSVQLLDNGTKVCVNIDIDVDARTACVDFTGSSPQHDSNFNAPLAVVHAAVLYVFRCLVTEQIPLNDGCLRPLKIIVPEGSMLNPRYPAAVVAGNVEVSQVIVDALFAALGIKAAAQGTMNNLTWGTAEFQYYETLCGGDGASFRRDGASAVHTHMTNSRLTDPEVLEHRYPVRLEQFGVRPHSGGAGEFRGGDGAIRAIRFLQGMDVNLLGNRRRIAPAGLLGGESGACGSNSFFPASEPDQVKKLDGQSQLTVQAGDLLVIETPGGAGFGKEADR
ncbi:hydantoinase B/oxoprolinase family protein [Allohahella sp. A8]|uniref:hydantoinase B/oxoprolinase family protein n=1 Tax=Allohahella sp. A8 TaxID=3141461 RepID=UPI003A80DAE7